MSHLKKNCVLFSLILLLQFVAQAQPLRYELGQRTRAMEMAWDAQPDVEARNRATAHLKQAVTLFFAFKLNDAAKELDQARFALQGVASPEKQWAESLYVLPETRLLDKSTTSLGFTLDKLYATTDEVPKGAILQLSLAASNTDKVVSHFFPITMLPLQEKLSLNLAKAKNDDFVLNIAIRIGNQYLVNNSQTISVVNNLQDRMIALKKNNEGFTQSTVDIETAKNTVALLDSLANKKTLETNFPAARLLAETEAVQKSINAKQQFYGKQKTGQFWLTLPVAQGVLPVRILAPTAAKQGRPLPLVVALHGAGGSENMFFDTYGYGTIAKLCEQRGWLLVSPRGMGMKPERVPEMIEEIAKLYAIDRQNIFVVGHSMGAGQTVAVAQLAPEKFAGVAALGGGNAIRTPSEALKKLPFFVGIGTEDFALRGAKALHESLQKAEIAKINYREYPRIEHLTIVQVALKDVFAFFDGIAHPK